MSCISPKKRACIPISIHLLRQVRIAKHELYELYQDDGDSKWTITEIHAWRSSQYLNLTVHKQRTEGWLDANGS